VSAVALVQEESTAAQAAAAPELPGASVDGDGASPEPETD
jgi:hypothetical protein